MLTIEHPLTGAKLQVANQNFSDEMTWEEAKRACRELGKGWRLPTKLELEAIYEQLHKNDQGNFRCTFYWTSSVDYSEDYSGKAVNFCMNDGTAYSGSLSSNEDANSVRAVCNLVVENIDEIKFG